MTTQTGNKTKSKAPMVFDMTSNECIWSKAGVVAHRLCHNAFDCLSCSFDKAIQRKRAAVGTKMVWSRTRRIIGPARIGRIPRLTSAIAATCSPGGWLSSCAPITTPAPDAPTTRCSTTRAWPSPRPWYTCTTPRDSWCLTTIICTPATPGPAWNTAAGCASAWTIWPPACSDRPTNSACPSWAWR